ncbi:MAG: MBOAT family protein [Clostridia bacterium]|nr:MBOAT family protein [Clostridia bacterium]
MVFSSPIFLFGFLPVSLGLYFLISRRWQNAWLFLVSLVFYSWGEPVLCVVMLLSMTSAYLLAFPISKYKADRPRLARLCLFVSVGINLALLIFFKYTGFIIDNLRLIPALSPFLDGIRRFALPIGISFYTFQIISYTADLWRGNAQLQKNYISFGCYVTMFPQLIAGPIVKYSDVDTALRTRSVTIDGFATGIRRFAVGLAKKIIFGDGAGALFAYFLQSREFSPTALSAWGMMISYTLQIYFDFSGYSDMAIGLGRMLGFDFPENFNYPYAARSVTDFWRRWHITLSSFFREYVYIPLGGNRRGRARTYLNLTVVWLLTGLWHGAAWNFVLWGAYYLIFLIAEKTFLLKLLDRVPAVLGRIYTLFTVGVGWLLFSATSATDALSVIKDLFAAPALTTPQVSFAATSALPFLLLAAVLATPLPKQLCQWLSRRPSPAVKYAESAAILLLLMLGVAFAAGSSYSPFLYFNF